MQRIIRHHDAPAYALAWMPDGSCLFSAGKEGIIRRIDSESDAILDHWRAHDDWIYALAVHPRGHTLASASWSGQVLLHSIPPSDPP
jgi:WD40 repeat protein